MPKTFDNLIIVGRPACGKSEFIDFIKNISVEERASEFHIGFFEEVDDFPWLWQLCLEDDEREKRGEGRLYTEIAEGGFNLKDYNFRVGLVDRFNEVITERYLKRPQFYNTGTLLIEFARGKTDGFKTSLEKFKKDILENSAILYIDVSFAESFRRNNQRYKVGEEGSILSHKVPDKDMNEYFVENDWNRIAGGESSGYLKIGELSVPFVSMNNEPELPAGPQIASRYKSALDKLLELYSSPL